MKNFTLKKVIARRLDIRFDNKCNLKCRICSSKFSTSWYSDEVKLGLQPEKKSEVYKKTISSKVFDFIIEQLPNVNELFFAGGEPIIQDGHYAILEKAIELGISEKISLAYNTNFSTLKYKNKNIISIWDKFKEVWISDSAFKTMDAVDSVQKGFQHKAFNSKSEAHQKFLQKLEAKKNQLQLQFPHIVF